LLNLFLNLSDGTKATTVDVNNLLLKLIPLFGAERDVNSIHRVQDKIRSVSFPVNEELRNCIEKNLKKVDLERKFGVILKKALHESVEDAVHNFEEL
uniref:DEK_C domain-containing protein n=1 Tax=Anisakis simplex TaxID=6269 RepID=A0A0M3J2J9_ANISI